MWGEWIEMETVHVAGREEQRLSPCGESGLKFLPAFRRFRPHMSLPVWGEWIEIAVWTGVSASLRWVSPRVGRVD